MGEYGSWWVAIPYMLRRWEHSRVNTLMSLCVWGCSDSLSGIDVKAYCLNLESVPGGEI